MTVSKYRFHPRSVAGGVLAFLLLGTPLVHAQKTTAVSGVTEPFQDVTLGVSVPGILSRLVVKEGDFVKAGQALVELEKRTEELEVQRRKLVMDSKAELDGATAKVETTKADYESTRKLFEATNAAKFVSKDDLAKKELEYKLAIAEMERLKTAEEREVIEYEMTKETLRERTLVAPMAGFVVQLFKDRGESCKAQDPLVRMVVTGQFYFVANVEARSAYNLKVGQDVQVEVEVGKKTAVVPGKISFVSPVVDPASGLVRTKVLCNNAEGLVRPGVAGTLQLKAE